jgi:hypothetical protein
MLDPGVVDDLFRKLETAALRGFDDSFFKGLIQEFAQSVIGGNAWRCWLACSVRRFQRLPTEFFAAAVL